ncbi:arylsulfatase [Persicobacter diffluens]|uniref:Arylsulfatase n=1 Tax=Persicobacter diffluens TaxID=981 RepID=A0AAN4W1Q0_9BACT|nr:arylsulfatase [Persicobacter diffluens]
MRYFFTLLALLFCLQLGAQNPNVVVILADDLGTGDISHYRKLHSDNIILETPHLDRLATSGMIFTNAHAPAALCAPSRYAIMTGNSCYRSPFPWGVWGAYDKSPIADESEMTLGHLMKNAGYQTAFFGKWHLGGDFRSSNNANAIYRGSRNKAGGVDLSEIVGGGPQFKGFEYSFTYPAGIQAPPYAVYENGKWLPLNQKSEITFITKEMMAKKGVKLDKGPGMGDTYWDPKDMGPMLAKKAVAFIEQTSKKQPFFMYYCSQAVHVPHTPPESLNGIKIAGTTPSAHMDMIKELNVQMGMLVEALKKKGVYENTIFIFTSDNGGLQKKATIASGHKSSSIYRGGKNTPFEGGHRVPFMVSWPNKIKANQQNSTPVLGLDIMSTLAEITNQKLPENGGLDSYNLLPHLLNEKRAKERPFLITQGGTGKEVIITEGDWKLIIQVDKKDKTNATRSPSKLFNLKDNLAEREQDNLINKPDQQERISRMFEKYNQLRDGKAITRKATK